MNQTWENGKKLSFGPGFGPLGPNSGCFFLFFKKVTRYHGQLSSCIISEKTDDPILRKICDKHTDGCDFIGCYQTNVENPKHKSMKFSWNDKILSKNSNIVKMTIFWLLSGVIRHRED